LAFVKPNATRPTAAISALNAASYDMSAAINQLTTRLGGPVTKNNGPSFVLDPTTVVP